MGFGQSGFDNVPKGGGGADPSKVTQFFFGKEDQGSQHTRRVLFLDGARGMPFGFHLHSHYIKRTGVRIEEVCLIKNNLGKVCPLCEHEVADKNGEMKAWYPTYVGCFSLMLMGRPVREGGGLVLKPIMREYKGKEYRTQWERRHLLLNRGGDKKPGMLPRLVDLVAGEFGVVAPDLPDLTGVVCDVYRNVGDQTDRVGDVWKVVKTGEDPLRVPADRWLSYCKSRGLAEADLERVEKFNLLAPIDHAKFWEERVKTPDQLREVLARAHGEKVEGGHATAGSSPMSAGDTGEQRGRDYEGGPGDGENPPGWIPGDQIPIGDDDIPF